METFKRLTKLHQTKNDDYCGDRGPYFNFEFADTFKNLFSNSRDKVYATIVGVKLARLSVTLSKATNHESTEDTFDDLIVYFAIWKADYINRNKK